MSKKFNPLSTAVAVATASLIVAVAGCAMEPRTSDGTTVAGDSRDSDRNSERIAQTTPADPTVVANQSLPGNVTNPPADSSQMAQSGQYPTDSTAVAQPSQTTDTSATPYPATQTAQAQPSTTYPGSTATYPSSSTGMSSSSTSSTPASTSTTTPTDSSSSMTTTTTDQPLPPRSDRN